MPPECPLAVLQRTVSSFNGRQLQHGMNDRSSGEIDRLVAGHLALLDQSTMGRSPRPFFTRKLASS